MCAMCVCVCVLYVNEHLPRGVDRVEDHAVVARRRLRKTGIYTRIDSEQDSNRLDRVEDRAVVAHRRFVNSD
jgi:hypothetical protein